MENKPNKNIAKRSPLGSAAVVLEGDIPRDYSPKAVKKELKETGLAATETIRVRNEVSGKVTDITIERDGTPESKLILALADKGKTRDQKDSILSMYLFERGKDNASFLMDLFRFKGEHTKETRMFKSQVRFDFEQFVATFCNHLDAMARMIVDELDINFEDFKGYAKGYAEYLKNHLGASFRSYMVTIEKKGMDASSYVFMREAIGYISEADKLREVVKAVAKNREADRGKGIYLDASGRPYSIQDESIDIHEIIDADRKRIADLATEDLQA